MLASLSLFSQRIRLEWLEYTTNLVLAGNSRYEIISVLNERLKEQLSVGNDPERGNRDKAITILMKVWMSVPRELQELRDEGLKILQRLHPNERKLVHWCMCMAVYPFFGRVADATGRLIRLQGSAAAAHVQRRVREQMGERETVSRATRRVLRAFIDWDVLQETNERGVYSAADRSSVNDIPLSIWAIQALLFAKVERQQSSIGLLQGPHLFPFNVAQPPLRELESCTALIVNRHGLNHEVLVGLASNSGLR